jgi:NhaP-type Na+/H+ or K+/H+ antiporter
MFVFGFVVHALHESVGLGNLGESVLAWDQVHPHVILYGLLPPLLFESAFNMHYHVFERVATSSLLLAGPGVMLALGLTALLLKALFASYHWSWAMLLMFSSILSATDPVAVVAVLHTLGAPEKLSVLIEGESLFNDGSAFVMFLIFENIIAGGFTTGKTARDSLFVYGCFHCLLFVWDDMCSTSQAKGWCCWSSWRLAV